MGDSFISNFFTPATISLMNNFYLADVMHNLCRMNRDFSSGQTFREFDCDARSERILPKHEASCAYFAMIQEIPQQTRQRKNCWFGDGGKSTLPI